MKVFNPLVFLVIGLAFVQNSSTASTETSTTEQATTTNPPTTTRSSTTEPSTKTTTEAPATTTPELPTTTRVPTTTDVPTTTKPPGPLEGHWSVTDDDNVTCIRADLKVEFKIPEMNDTIFLSPNASSTSSNCHLSNDTQTLILEFENYVFSLEFEKDATNTFVRNVSFSSNTVDVFYNDSKLFSVKNGNSYLCKSTDGIALGNATMHIFNIQIQAFGVANETNFSTFEECELDDSVSDIVPIAVSCALAGLIIIVLIAYLIGRRSRQTGYTTVS